MKRDITVYVASAWWRECDPHSGVVALSADKAERAIDELMEAESEREFDSIDDYCICGEDVSELDEAALTAEHGDCGLDEQAWSGVFPESLRDVLRNARDRQTILEDLRSSGVAYLEV